VKKGIEIQLKFIEALRAVIPAKISIAEEIASILEVSPDSAYRRLRGETAISLDEAHVICKKYGMSIDHLFSSKSNSVQFEFNPIISGEEHFLRYLNVMLGHLQNIAKQPDKKLIYAADEIPIFHSFNNEMLAEFKLFYWGKSVMNLERYQNLKFEPGIVPKEHLALAKEINKAYLSIPSVEIWSHETIFTTTRQIEYFLESGQFASKEIAIEIVNKLRDMAKDIMHCAEKGLKDDDAFFQLYQSDVVLGTNCINVYVGDSKFTYISFNAMNAINTSNQAFCEETDKWLKNMIKKSTLISGISEKQRYQFFDRVFKNIDATENKVKNH